MLCNMIGIGNFDIGQNVKLDKDYEQNVKLDIDEN